MVSTSKAMSNKKMERSGFLATQVQWWINYTCAESAFSLGMLYRTTQKRVKREKPGERDRLFTCVVCELCSGLPGSDRPQSLACHLQSVSNGLMAKTCGDQLPSVSSTLRSLYLAGPWCQRPRLDNFNSLQLRSQLNLLDLIWCYSIPFHQLLVQFNSVQFILVQLSSSSCRCGSSGSEIQYESTKLFSTLS